MSIPERLNKLMEIANWNQTKVAELGNITQASVSRILGGATPGSDFLTNLAKNGNVNPLWLLTGEGEMFKHESTILDEKESEEFRQVNVYLHQNMDVFEFIQNLKQEPRKTHGKVKSLLGKLLGLSTKDLERLEAYLEGMGK
ncbi:XRE family transcriptional regulator [Leptospira bouyouniensis]|uniref:XRE family transcriptional regulator n=1 Tax=Leptospira bouyouniensis TaxID=2484911 RepID=A0A7I0HSB1_9LEPT|nr:helix-turn-helix transcriptional regulator [Leptospira bouyouniensis]TGL06476.1 XRE family transcriptional regulator [Leptospira bouyouniensis]